VLTILFLIQDRRERRQLAVLRSQDPPPIMGGSVDMDAPPDFSPDVDEPAAAPGVRRGFLPAATTLDVMAYRVIAFAFPIWTFAVIAGAIWAQEAWGRYWGWDPKETWSFITWVIYAGYLHARSTSGWKGRPAAVVALAGFVSLLITYYAVNLWIVGLHSYKGF
jgi:cytochrome c-type biogenesis protein CcsB